MGTLTSAAATPAAPVAPAAAAETITTATSSPAPVAPATPAVNPRNVKWSDIAPPAKTEPQAPAAAATPAKPASDIDPAKAEAAKPATEEPANPAVPAKPAPDPIAEGLASLNRITREAQKRRDALKAKGDEYEAHTKDAGVLAQVREALGSKDIAKALRAVAPELNLNEAALLMLQQAEEEPPKQLTESDIARITQEKIEEERKAAVTKAETEQADKLVQAQTMFVDACAAEFQASEDKYPLVGALGVSSEKIQEYTEQHFREHHAVPSPAETMQHFETQYQDRVTKRGFVRAQVAAVQSAPASSAASALPTATAMDTGGAASPPMDNRRKTMREIEEETKRKIAAAWRA